MKLKNSLLAVADMGRALAFYENVLSLQVILDLGANKTLTGGLCLQTLETWTEFLEGKPVTFGGNDAEVYFEEDDLDAFAGKLETFDLQYVHPVKEHRWGQGVVRFYDPDMHVIEVREAMTAVFRRFLDGGMDVPVEYVRGCIR